MTVFRMPSLGADMESGTLVEWLVRPGDRVKRGDVVAVVETAKGAIEIEVFQDGVVRALIAEPGAVVPVGAPLAEIAAEGAAAEVAPAPPTPQPAVTPPKAPAGPTAAPPPQAGRVRVTPAARRRAAALGIALERLRGTGVDGAICLADLPSPAPPKRVPAGFDPAAMRAAIAAAMSRSKREIPHYYLSETVDVSAALDRLTRINAERDPPARLLPAAILLRAAALAIAATPEVNGWWEDGRFRAADGVHVGWAVALRGGGLIAPAIRDADRLALDPLMAALRDLVQRARGFALRGSELTSASITITNLGERGAASVLPVIHPPQVAMLGIGRIVVRPWVVDGTVQPRQVVTLTLAGDHRATDGHVGGLLLTRLAALLADAERL
ncbi:dihydrolipoamide acetyltransferase family protein [Elioraea tepidiphila]|jgi:pyruvate dehydrogenase E2 component (dihydrolipoamide acetyltransferase)|uniref:dihydrolipoamide acetyltransferase family protein n=1 Tax=Elioraea tepidiphila TaxID=457934 RepID=UPI00036EA745|nr:dihydrolipoamide acetyltransferase family protein [Elioraea tepidiphila]